MLIVSGCSKEIEAPSVISAVTRALETRKEEAAEERIRRRPHERLVPFASLDGSPIAVTAAY
jgi:hypothetical protein